MGKPVDKALLLQYIQGRCNAAETARVREFLLEPAWQQALDELLEEDFRHFDSGPPPVGLAAHWHARFHEKYGEAPVRPLWQRPWLRYAAAALVLLAAGLYVVNTRLDATTRVASIPWREVVNPRGQRATITLPDSSVIYLGADSRVKYPEKFSAGTRAVYLTGEAFFDVTKDSRHPFIVYTGSVQTRVLGTSFKINTFDPEALIVSVATGTVRVDHQAVGSDTLHTLAVLTPGKEVTWREETSQASVRSVDVEAVTHWKDGDLYFVAATLGDIARQLERKYDVQIRFQSPQAERYHVSLILKNTDSLVHALDILCATTHLRYQKAGRVVTIVSPSNEKL